MNELKYFGNGMVEVLRAKAGERGRYIFLLALSQRSNGARDKS
jgi:hypothetical protein